MSNFWKSFLCVLACVLFCAVSFFTGYFFRDTVKIKQYETVNSLSAVSPADAVSSNYSYHSSNFPLLLSVYEENSNTLTGVINSIEYLPFTFYLNTYIGEFSGSPSINPDEDPFSILGFSFNLGFQSFNIIEYESPETVVYNQWQDLSRYLAYPYHGYIFYSYYINSLFNFNVTRIEISTEMNYLYKGSSYASYIIFYDNNDNTCRFQFRFDKDKSNVNKYYLDTRTYYLLNNFNDNDYYNQGYKSGYNSGVNDGTSLGYKDGYNVGYDDGTIDGYNDGVNAANSYSFSNLLTAVVNAPVSVFTNLLDFNIMGFDLLSLAAGLLTLGLIVLIIKLCLGGK